MSFNRTAIGLAVLAVAASCGAADPSPMDGEARILVFSKTAAFRHPSIEAGVAMIRRIADELEVAVDATEDARTFTPGNLDRYQVVVFLSTTGDVLDAAQQQAMEGFVRAGGGYVGIHAASDTEYDWLWYGALVGAYFAGHPSNPNVRTGTLLVADPDHPSTRALPSPWTRDDEWYDVRDVQPGLSPLLHIDESSYKAPGESPAADPRPIAWYREFDGGRSFYSALGHTVESYSEPLFQAHVRGGLEWVLGR